MNIENYTDLLRNKNYEIIPTTKNYKGHNYYIFNEITGDSNIKRIIKGIGAFFLTLFTLGGFLALSTGRHLWQAALFGKITHYVNSNSLPEETRNISRIAIQTLDPTSQELTSNFAQNINSTETFLKPVENHQQDYIEDLANKQNIFKQGFLSSSVIDRDLKLNIQLTSEQQATLKEAYKKCWYKCLPNDPYSIIRGGEHYVIILKSLPDVVFKVRRNLSGKEKEIDHELEIYQNAFDIVKSEKLHTLKIPQCAKLSCDIDGKPTYFLIQERLDTEGSFDFQKGLYCFAFEQADMQPFMQQCFLDLLKFICLAGFWDVKYDNIPFLSNGQGIGLYDLNKGDPIAGLFYGGAHNPFDKSSKYDGLLNYAPNLAFLHDLVQECERYLTAPDLKQRFSEAWQKYKDAIEQKIQKRAAKREQMKKFIAESGIHNMRQELDPKKIPYSVNNEIKAVQEYVVEEINREIQKSVNFDLVQSRRVQILDISHRHSMLWKNNKQIIPAMEQLKQAGVIAHFSYNRVYRSLTVRC